MLAKELITDAVITIKTSDTVAQALLWMDEYKVSHLPIVNNEEFLGLISESDLAITQNHEDAIGSLALSLSNAYITQNQHVFDVLKMASLLNLSIVPVLNDNKQYLGVIPLSLIIKTLAELSSAINPGGIIVLEINTNDYSMTEIAQIVESNDAKILSSYIRTHSESTKIELTLKINKIDISPVLQTFNRYNYQVKASFFESDTLEDLYDRYQSLMRYLDI